MIWFQHMPRRTHDILTLTHSPQRSIHSLFENPHDKLVTCSFACVFVCVTRRGLRAPACLCVLHHLPVCVRVSLWGHTGLCVDRGSSDLIWFPPSWLMWNSRPDVAEITTPCSVLGGEASRPFRKTKTMREFVAHIRPCPVSSMATIPYFFLITDFLKTSKNSTYHFTGIRTQALRWLRSSSLAQF